MRPPRRWLSQWRRVEHWWATPTVSSVLNSTLKSLTWLYQEAGTEPYRYMILEPEGLLISYTDLTSAERLLTSATMAIPWSLEVTAWTTCSRSGICANFREPRWLTGREQASRCATSKRKKILMKTLRLSQLPRLKRAKQCNQKLVRTQLAKPLLNLPKYLE